MGVELECHILDTGHCLASEHLLISGGRRRRVECHSIAVLLGHPTRGWFLFDTGYAPRLVDCTRRLPLRAYRWAAPLRVRAELAVVEQLRRRGLRPDDVRAIVLSHFHADHIAGLHDFPRAEIWAAHAAYADVAGRSGLSALRRAFMPALLPADFERRAHLLPRFRGESFAGVGATHDLFGDGAALLVDLPGHARGQIGLLASTRSGTRFFVADSCWTRDGYRSRRPPHRLAWLLVDDWSAMLATIDGLHELARARPEIDIVPTHCPEAFRQHVVQA